MHFDCNYYKDGKWSERTTPTEITPEWKEACKKAMLVDSHYWTHINKVFVPPVSPMSGEGVMCRWVMMEGHGDELTRKWYKTGLLDGLKPNQLGEAASYMNRVAQEIIAITVRDKIVKGSPEEKRMDDLAGIIIPVGRIIFEQYPVRPDPKFLVEDVLRFFDEKHELYEDLKTGMAQDHEQQFQQLYVMHFKERWTPPS
jgi:hypothetical protein